MKNHVIRSSELKQITEFKEKSSKQLKSLNDDLYILANGGGKCSSLDKTAFMPTGPKAYQLTESKQYQTWLITRREATGNPMLGKDYFSAAPEYGETSEKEYEKVLNDKESTNVVEDYVDETGKSSIRIKEDYDPNGANSVDDTEEMGEDEKQVFDFAAIKDTVIGHLEWKMDDIMDAVEDTLGELHSDDENYHQPENLRSVVEEMQHIEKAKLLTYKEVHPSLLPDESNVSKK